MPEGKSDYKLLFVVGFPRSGTTWMMWLLGQHPSSVVCFHSGFFHALKPLRDWWEDKGGVGKSVYTYESNDEEDKIKLNSILSLDEFYDRSRSLASNVFDTMANCGENTEVVVEKTPENLEFSEWILKIFPDAYILHVIRDPRSIFPSFRKAAYSWAPVQNMPVAPNPIEVAKGWCSYIERGRKLRELTDNYYEVHYEALSENGSAELEKIYSWLNLSADRAFCKHVIETGNIDTLRKQKGLAPKGFFRRGSAKWQDELTASETRIIEYLAGDLLSDMGYPLTFGDLSHKPFRISLYEAVTKIVQKYSRSSRSLLGKIFRPLNGRLNPHKRVQVLKKTIAGMTHE